MTKIFDNQEMNILAEAIVKAAEAKDFKDDAYRIYTYFDETPKASLIVEIVQELNRLGYSIAKTK